ncbi:MAG: hypothetical protein F4003_08015 [Acidimicrobiaceae bacterium]|nr:hypothetical protein [Acidimicrobiaceae bacterium]MYC42275.1 hypothetical protein [Acidimicrobiaceae bacterium]
MTTLSLEPLNRSAVREYLESEPYVDDPAAFISEIVANGLEFMLDNPLLLRMLIASASDTRSIPSSREKVFERACRTLATEHNESHPQSAMPRSPETVLAAAGLLFAVQLLASKDGYARNSAYAEVGFVPLSEVRSEVNDNSASEDALSTNLFTGTAEQHLVPVHRQVAEYLGASHLAGLIGRGDLSAGRVCGVLTSPLDGKVVTDLRGLAAWLGSLSAPARDLLIEADPVGMALYGDVSDWPVEDRRQLLRSLSEQTRPEDLGGPSWFDKTEHRYRHAIGQRLGSLCKPDIADSVDEHLDGGSVPALRLVLLGLAEAESGWLGQFACLTPRLEQLLLESTIDEFTRLLAVDAFKRISPSGEASDRALLEVLQGVEEGRIEDSDSELTGTLLWLLYPRAVTLQRVWRYFPNRANILILGRYWQFWEDRLLKGSSVEELRELLEGLASQPEQTVWDAPPTTLEEIVPKLLLRLLNESDRIRPEDVYRWLLTVLDQRIFWNGRRTDEWNELAAKIYRDPVLQKSLIRLWLQDEIKGTGGLGHDGLRQLIFGSLPGDIVSWCATEARASLPADAAIARTFATLPIRCGNALDQTREETIHQLRSEYSNEPELLRYLDEYLTPSRTQEEFERSERIFEAELEEIRAEHERKRRERQEGWRDLLRQSRDEPESNCITVQNLHTLALAYFGLIREVSRQATPIQRVAELVGDKGELLEKAMKALRDSLLRGNLPPVERTAQLISESKHDWLAFPVLAGLAIRESENPQATDRLDDETKRRAVAVYSAVTLMPDQQPDWPKRWVSENPPVVLDVLYRCSLASIEKGDTYLTILNWLEQVDGLEDELHDFRLRLLKSLSVRLPLAQLPILDRLIYLLSKHLDPTELRKLVAQKLAARSMTDAQRIRWMIVDVLVNAGEALHRLDEFIGTNSKRAQHLASFLGRYNLESSSGRGTLEFVGNFATNNPAQVLHALVGVLARHFPPREWRNGRLGDADKMSDLVRSWITDLGGLPTEESGSAFDDLIADKRLSAWRSELDFARYRQQRLQRDTSFKPMGVREVLALLQDGPPADVSDLHVLFYDRLGDLADCIRGDNSDPWRQFWADDRGSPPKQPKSEDSCRDALLAMLRTRLPEDVDAQPEGQYASDRRADLRVVSKDFNVPVEIKKNSHPDLWTAIDDQLISKYTTDPQTDGYGVYAVLWFGSGIDGYPRHPTAHDRPGTPDELKQRLIASLSHEQRRKIGVVVLDVTKPQAQPSRQVKGRGPAVTSPAYSSCMAQGGKDVH